MNRFVVSAGVAGRAPDVRASRWRWRTALRWALPAATLLGSCGGKMGDGAALGGETHFLVTCGQGCGDGLSCIAGVCTRSCEPGYSSCSELSSLAACVSAPEDAARRTPFGGTCDVSCATDSDCSPLGTGYACRSGACRAEPEARQASFASQAEALVRAVEADTCRSGLLWVGGEQASAEMHPGSDCLSCHGEGSKRPLLLAGTVYASGAPRKEQPLDDCFGLEGVEVIIRESDPVIPGGRELSTVTNRAGNFYFEGRLSDFPIPYTASLRWTVAGQVNEVPMLQAPSYGGCANCHNRFAEFRPQPDTSPEEDPKRVVAAGGVLYPPGLYPE